MDVFVILVFAIVFVGGFFGLLSTLKDRDE